MNTNDIVIVAAKRTPMGNFLGGLASLSAPQLQAEANKAALKQAGIKPEDIDEVFNGCVLQAGVGQAPARQAAIFSDIPNSTPATTINKMCGSGMRAIMFAADSIKLGTNDIVLAGGMESMSNSPYLIQKARAGYRIGHGELKDHMYIDGLEDAYDKGKLMGVFAEETAKKYNFSREEQDDFAQRSLKLALQANNDGSFKNEIVPITIETKKGTVTIDKDEGPTEEKISKIRKLKPAFSKDGTVTAANSSSISDGAASVILMTAENAQKHHIKPLAKIVAYVTHSQEPQWFTTAPQQAIKKVLEKANWNIDDVDLFEINEAFAVVAMSSLKDLHLPLDKLNVHGGACALGHPIGASGARILVTLIYALKQKGLKKGVAALCIGGGEATAMAIELLD